MFDDGEVLPGLDDTWTFMGANAMEWAVGLVVFLMIGSFARTPASAMPAMMTGWIVTTACLASTRRLYPDQERGVRNAVMSSCGFNPTDIPAPAILQPVWSASPLEELSQESNFRHLDLDVLFPSFTESLEEPEVS